MINTQLAYKETEIQTPSEIEEMAYVDFISLLDETNRCPGGYDTLRRIAINAFITDKSEVLEIGSNTGFSSLEMSHMTKCRVLGIDPVASAVEQANMRLNIEDEAIRERVSFQVGSAYEIKAKDKTFDLIIAGGATSFMKEKEKPVTEYYRVLKNWGYLSVAHLYYATTPPEAVIDAVSETIGVRIPVWSKNEWNNLFSMDGKFEQVWEFDNKTQVRTKEEIDEYVSYFLKKPHISALSLPVQQAIGRRWSETLLIFNENQKYTRYSVRLYRKPLTPSEPELFPAEANDAN